MNKSVIRFKEDAGERSTWTFEDKNEYSRLTQQPMLVREIN